jgi:Ca2+-binding RTX toxin-like protein
VLVAAACAIAPSAADASRVEAPTVWGRTAAIYTADPGEANDVTVSFDGRRYLITDEGARISTGDGCEITDGAAAHQASCDSGGVEWARLIELHLGDLGDRLTASVPRDPHTSPFMSVTGDGGADRLSVEAPGVAVDGGSGDDDVTAHAISGGADGGEGTDLVTGGFEHGELDGGPGADTLVTLEQVEPANASDISGMHQIAHGGDGNDRVDGHGLVDSLYGDAGDDVVIAGPGNDGVAGGPGDDELHGGDGSDNLYGGEGTDVLDGGGGDGVSRGTTGYAIAGARLFRDNLDGGPGADVLQGGDGDFDAADYSSRTAPIKVTLDGIANDGEAGENDLVAADVEDTTGGNGDDVLIGNGGPNTLRGGGGGDLLDGHGGYQDTVFGGSGDDTILLADGGLEAERGVQGAVPGFAFDDGVYCNGGEDTAFVDPTDAGEAGEVFPLTDPCEHVVRTDHPQMLPVYDGLITLPIGCGPGPAQMICDGVATVMLPRTSRAAAVPHAAGRAVARHRFHRRFGRSHRVRVRMNRAGRRAARGHRSLRAWVTYSYR